MKEHLAKVKLSEELHIGLSAKGIKAESQLAYAILSSCVTCTETVSKWLAEKLASTEGDISIILLEDESLELYATLLPRQHT